MSVARMIRHRGTTMFSPPHALWMLFALLLVIGNWISLWDFHNMATIPAIAIASGFVFNVLVYLISALVSPDVNKDGITDLRAFHESQGPTYMGAALALLIVSVIVNLAAGASLGIQNWANENAIVFAMFVPVIAALTIRRPWVQIGAPLVLTGLMTAYVIIYYPVLK